MKFLRILPALLLLFPLLAMGESGRSREPRPKKLRVLATFGPIYSLTANIVGEAAEIEQFLPPGGDPHHFALAPSDLKRLARADVIVENGLRLEEWVSGALRHSPAIRITASRGIRTDDGNPHVWLDPILAIKQVENIAEGLAKADPANAALYQRNATLYIRRLRKLDEEIRAVTDRLRDKRLMTAHSAFHYFAKRYGFKVVGVFHDTPGQEPGPRQLRRLRETIREENVRVLFAEPGHSPRTLVALSRELKVPVVEIDPMERNKPSADLYERVTLSNLRKLREALGARR